jgi:outer membrane biosynthesis protein TonB
MRLFPRPVPREIKASFNVSKEGTIGNIRLISSQDIDKMLDNALIRELKSWRFPTLETPIGVVYTFAMQ